MKKKIGLLLMSVVLMVALAFGLTACGDKKPEEDNPPPAPPVPTVSVDVTSVSLIHGETTKVTATVTNSDKAAAFKLATGGDAYVTLSVDSATPNEAVLCGIADGDTNLLVELEGVATPVTVPVSVDGAVRLTVPDVLTDTTKVLDAKVTGEDDGESVEVEVEHYLDGGKVEYAIDGDAAKIAVDGNKCTVTAHQAGVATLTVTVSVPKAAEEETPETPEAQAEEGEGEGETPVTPPVEYEAIQTETYTVVCTDDYNELATKHVSAQILDYAEVKKGEEVVGYKAYISAEHADDVSADLEDASLYVPALHNRKPVVGLAAIGGTAISTATGYFVSFEDTVTTPESAELREVYTMFDNIYLPCTLTEIPALTFRLTTAKRIEVQKDNHITVIGTQAFNQTTTLEYFNLEDLTRLETIKNNAFQLAVNAKLELVVPNSVTVIEELAFANMRAKRLEFALAEKVDEAYAPSIVLKSGAAGSGSGAFFATEIDTIVLRNIKQSDGGASILQNAKVDLLIIGEDIGTMDFNGTPISVLGFNGGGWTMAMVFHKDKEDVILFEGANNWMPSHADSFVGVDNCGALFGTFTGFIDPTAPDICAPKKLYVHKDNTVSTWLQGYYEQNTSFVGEGIYADYTEWTKK